MFSVAAARQSLYAKKTIYCSYFFFQKKIVVIKDQNLMLVVTFDFNGFKSPAHAQTAKVTKFIADAFPDKRDKI